MFLFFLTIVERSFNIRCLFFLCREKHPLSFWREREREETFWEGNTMGANATAMTHCRRYFLRAFLVLTLAQRQGREEGNTFTIVMMIIRSLVWFILSLAFLQVGGCLALFDLVFYVLVWIFVDLSLSLSQSSVSISSLYCSLSLSVWKTSSNTQQQPLH